TFDTTAPAGPTLAAIPVSPSSSRTIGWSFTAEPAALTTCALSRDSVTVATSTTSTARTDYHLAGAADGTYALTVDATDAPGNTGPATEATYELDTTGPGPATVTAAPPAAGQVSTVFWSFTTDPVDTATCTLRRDGTVVSQGPCQTPVGYDLSRQPDGVYTFTVTTVDALGNPGPSRSDTYRLDRTPPAAAAIASGPPQRGSERDVTWSFTGEAGSTATCSL